MANIQINSLSQLEQIIKKAVVKSLDGNNLGKDVKEDVQKHIREDVYAVYHPESYQTTGEFHDSVISTEPEIIGDSVQISIEHDSNLMYMNEPWYHQSVIDGRDSRDSLPEIIHNGLTHDLWNHKGRAYLEPRPYMDNTVDEYQNTKKHVKKVAQYLREQGLEVKEG